MPLNKPFITLINPKKPKDSSGIDKKGNDISNYSKSKVIIGLLISFVSIILLFFTIFQKFGWFYSLSKCDNKCLNKIIN